VPSAQGHARSVPALDCRPGLVAIVALGLGIALAAYSASCLFFRITTWRSMVAAAVLSGPWTGGRPRATLEPFARVGGRTPRGEVAIVRARP